MPTLKGQSPKRKCKKVKLSSDESSESEASEKSVVYTRIQRPAGSDEDEDEAPQEKKKAKPRMKLRNREDILQNSHKGKTAKVKKDLPKKIFVVIFIYSIRS